MSQLRYEVHAYGCRRHSKSSPMLEKIYLHHINGLFYFISFPDRSILEERPWASHCSSLNAIAAQTPLIGGVGSGRLRRIDGFCRPRKNCFQPIRSAQRGGSAGRVGMGPCGVFRFRKRPPARGAVPQRPTGKERSTGVEREQSGTAGKGDQEGGFGMY